MQCHLDIVDILLVSSDLHTFSVFQIKRFLKLVQKTFLTMYKGKINRYSVEFSF